ncbi:response regulator [Paenibacillus sp. DYY-L-2]|uniref:response regulator n=1 Tax=Paenibacillus sp. DYY-L-2 TaxID=3447013 RepID=UPI003F500357
MLRIVIADDEMTIREGMAKMVAKESDRFTVTGTFANGEEVLDFAASSDFDVVITDIRMPLVDGLELIKELKLVRPEARCIIMSGFTDFEYARQALRYSAVDYLLKPINKKQLFALLYELDEKKETSLGQEERLRSGLLVSYLQSSTALCSKLPGLVLPRPYYAVTVLKGEDMEALRSNVSLLRRQPEDHCFDIVDPGDGGITLISYYEEPPEPGDIAVLADRLRRYPQPGIVLAGSSRGYGNPGLLSQAFAEAKAACDRGMYEEEPWNYTSYHPSFEQTLDVAERFALSRESLVQALQVLNISRAGGILDELFAELREAKASRNTLLSLCRHVCEAAGAELPEWNKTANALHGSALEDQIRDGLTFAEIKNRFAGEFTKSLQRIREGRLEHGGKSVEIVKKWIAEHYDQPAELGHLAGLVYLTPSYLSKLFKQETGMTITDYLIEVRIRKAKELLSHSSEMKVHEVGCEVGYPDPAYFNKLFKRIVGVTPNEYKRISQSS